MSEPFNDLKQVEMSIKAAQKMVGAATMSMEPEQLQQADSAIQDAKLNYSKAKKQSPGVDDTFFETAEELLSRCEEQLQEAKR
jgi:hypothetical protein